MPLKPELKRAIQVLRHFLFAIFTALSTPEKGFPARRTVVARTFRPGPLHAAFFITILGDFRTPHGNSPFHDVTPGGKGKFFNEVAGPFLALIAGIITS
jgi:hypothetical protein